MAASDGLRTPQARCAPLLPEPTTFGANVAGRKVIDEQAKADWNFASPRSCEWSKTVELGARMKEIEERIGTVSRAIERRLIAAERRLNPPVP
jgi:hypothetical protein